MNAEIKLAFGKRSMAAKAAIHLLALLVMILRTAEKTLHTNKIQWHYALTVLLTIELGAHMRSIFLLLLLMPFMPAHAQGTANCVRPAQIEEIKSNLRAQYQQYQGYAKEYADTSKQQMQALEKVRQCQSEKNLLDDLTDALTLQSPKCEREINEYNLGIDKLQNYKQIMKAQQTLMQTEIVNLNMATVAVCPN